MPDHSIPAIRQRFLEDMRAKGLSPKTQTMYLRAMRDFTRFIGRSPDKASPEDLRAFQLDMADSRRWRAHLQQSAQRAQLLLLGHLRPGRDEEVHALSTHRQEDP